MGANWAAFWSFPFERSVKVLPLPQSVPVGTLVLPKFTALLTSSMPIWREAISFGSSCTRIAYFCAP